MNYRQTLQYMYGQLPMFHRIGKAAYKADLDNTIAICRLLGNPEKKFKSIHIAGTNGKGSTSHYLAAVLQSAGYKVGLYTSPHLKDFRERIRINGKMIPQKRVVEFISRFRADFEKIKPSFFEMTVGMAFDHFAREQVDIAVIETGLGGRLDSTNVIRPLVSVITNISFDHQDLLGDTLEKIAGEKAGIIKRRVPVVIGEKGSTQQVFLKKAKSMEAPIVFAEDIFKTDGLMHTKGMLQMDVYRGKELYLEKLRTGLQGLYQGKNIPTVLASLEALGRKGFPVTSRSIRTGIEKVVSKTGLLGRWQVLGRHPLVICDTGHNKAGISEVLAQVKHTPHKKLHFVLGMVGDKDISGILAMLPKNARYYFCRASIPRALDDAALCKQARKAGLKGYNYGPVAAALAAAKKAASRSDLIFIGGSTFTVAEVI